MGKRKKLIRRRSVLTGDGTHEADPVRGQVDDVPLGLEQGCAAGLEVEHAVDPAVTQDRYVRHQAFHARTGGLSQETEIERADSCANREGRPGRDRARAF